MRKMTITRIDSDEQRGRVEERGETAAMSREEAETIAPWAADLIETDGGWLAFESATDAETWRNQR